MGEYKEIYGDLIALAYNGDFDVIMHGCNSFCVMGAGIAVPMAKHFGCNNFALEQPHYKGDINKLGQIDYKLLHYSNWDQKFQKYPDEGDEILHSLFVVNAYSQYNYGRNHADGDKKPVDYEALTLCLRKVNSIFKGKHIGLPKISAGLAGGDWSIISDIIKTELKNCKVTVVLFKQ